MWAEHERQLRWKSEELTKAGAVDFVTPEPAGEDAGGGESVIEIYEPEDEADGEAIRIRVPGGGAGVDAWLKALDRCCRGERGDPKPAALA